MMYYNKPKYDENIKLCYMNRQSFIVYIKIDDIYKDTEEDFETTFDPLSYELD